MAVNVRKLFKSPRKKQAGDDPLLPEKPGAAPAGDTAPSRKEASAGKADKSPLPGSQTGSGTPGDGSARPAATPASSKETSPDGSSRLKATSGGSSSPGSRNAPAAKTTAAGKRGRSPDPAASAASIRAGTGTSSIRSGDLGSRAARSGDRSSPSSSSGGSTNLSGKIGSNAGSAGKGKKERSLKDRIYGIITFSDISIVNVVHMGFLLLLFIICGIAGITYSSLSSLSSAFNVVSDHATPMAMIAKSMESDLLLIHDDVNQILMERVPDRIAVHEKELSSFRESFQKSLEDFQEITRDEPKLQELIAGVQGMTDAYLSEISKIPALRGELLKRTAEVNKQKAAFGGLVRFFNNEETAFFAKIDDDFLLDSYRCMKAAQSTMESNTTTALDTDIPEKIQEYIKTNQSYLKEFNLNLNDLKAEIKDLENNLGTYISSFIYDTTNPNGLIYNHLKLAEETMELQRAADGAKENIIRIREHIHTVQKMANEAINQSNRTANSIFDRSRITLLVSVALSIVVALFVAFLVGRSIRVPLGRIISAISAMSDGVYVGRLGYRANNEFGLLTRRIKALRLQFADVLRQVSEGSNKVKNAAEANTDAATNTANGIQSQQRMTRDMVNAIEEMRASGAEMADSANETRKIVLQAGEAVTNGSDVINRNIESTRKLAEQIASTGERVNQVSAMSQNINSVIQVIRGVADQTNLLALNAAIEAARAGEHGRGFAVVADEVRSLASKTAAATNQIREVIEALQDSVGKSVDSMQECRNEMEKSISQTSDVHHAIQKIQTHLNVITEYSDKIVDAANNQASSTDAVAMNVKDIASISESNVEEINKVKEACLGLNELARSQTEWVSKFTF